MSWLPRLGQASAVVIRLVGVLAAARAALVRPGHGLDPRDREIEALRLALARERERTSAAEGATHQILANLSHELRTPLNGILGFVDLLVDSDLDLAQRRALEMVKSSGEMLSTVVDDLLDLSRIETQGIELGSEQIDVRELLEGVACLLASQAQDKGLEVACSVASDCARMLRGDLRRLRQVLINLTSNSIKFTDVGEIELRAATIPDDAGGSQLALSVRDTGIGMDEQTIASLFRPFFVKDGSDRRAYSGSGLGLAISNRLVGLMGGRIQVQSHIGHGSLFRVLLPIELDAKENASSHLDHGVREVLLVARSPALRRALGEGLREMGACVREALTIEEALSVLDACPELELVLLDRENGSSWRRSVDALRAHERSARAAIALLVPRAEAGMPRFAPLGGLCLLPKPARREELERCLAWTAGIHERSLFAGTAREDSAARETPPPAAGRSPRILLVEDNPVNQRLESAFLLKAGFEVELAENGLQAVQANDRDVFDLILMDVQMPIMDGLEATRAIRRRETAERHTPIIAVTARALVGDREACLAAGMDDYLTKPVSFERLVGTIRAWTAETGSAAAGHPIGPV